MAKLSVIILFFCAIISFFGGHNVTANSTEKHTNTVMCYIQTWITSINNKYDVSFFDARQCTYVIYLRLDLNPNTYEIKVLEPDSELNVAGRRGRYSTTTALKLTYSHLKVLISIGGWKPNEELKPFETMTNTPTYRQVFIKSAVAFLQEYNFDGIEIDFRHISITPSKKNTESFVALIQELNFAFEEHQWTLAVLISGYNKNAYNIHKISGLVEFINIMTYDFRGSWESKTGHNSPLFAGNHSSIMNVNEIVQDYISLGADHTKINIGLPFYGRTFALSNPSNNFVGAPTTNAPAPLDLDKKIEPGLIPYSKLCTLIRDTWCIKRDYESQVPYAFKNNSWISFDDKSSITDKVIYVVKNHLSGVMLYSLDMDDIHGQCHNRPMHLLTIVNEVFEQEYKKLSTTTPTFVFDPSQFQNNHNGNPQASNCAFFTSSAFNIGLSILISFHVTTAY